MRVLLLVYEWSFAGGLERVTVDLSRALLAAGASVDVWSLHDRGTVTAGNVAARGLRPPVPGMGVLRWPLLAARVARASRRYDVVIAGHPHLLGAAERGIRWGRSTARRWSWVYGLEAWGAAGEALAPTLRGADLVVSISEYTAAQVRRWVEADRLRIVPPSVDTDFFTPGAPAEVARDEVLVVGRMSRAERYKGHDVLIASMPHAERRLGRPLRLVIAGGGDDRAHIEELARRSPARERIAFAGRLGNEELLSAYRRCGVFAMPSRVEPRGRDYTGEGFGIVYVEAAACGRPVVASTDGGAPETVVEGRTALLADPRSPEDVGEKIAAALADPARADAMGAEGRRHAVEQFSMPRFRERVAALLREAAIDRDPGSRGRATGAA